MENTPSYEATGTIYKIYEAREISERFSLREFAIEIEGKFQPQIVKMQCANKRMELLDRLNVGDTITAHFDLRGRETEGRDGEPRVWNSLDVWRIEAIHTKIEQSTPAASTPAVEEDVPF